MPSSKVSTPPRPVLLTPDMAERAAAGIVANLIKGSHIEESRRDDAIEAVARQGARRPNADGYELAKALDEREGWACNLDIAKALDGWSWEAREEVMQAQRAWVAEHGIRPPLPAGVRVVVRWAGKDHFGTIELVYSHNFAKYAVKRDGETGDSRMIVNFEDVRAAGEAPDAG